MQPLDTNPKMEAIQISLIRKSSIARRISRLRSLSQTVIQLSQRAIMRANPGLSEQELEYKFVAYHYGKELADRLKRLNGHQPALDRQNGVLSSKGSPLYHLRVEEDEVRLYRKRDGREMRFKKLPMPSKH